MFSKLFPFGFPKSLFLTLNRSVRIEQNSVNSVILNDQPQDPHQRFMVAGKVGINATGSTVVAR